MDGDATREALEWQILQGSAATAKMWGSLATATGFSSSLEDPVGRALAVTVVFERAVRALPFSYKLWMQYINFCKADTRHLCTANEWFQTVRDVYERAVAKLPAMPLLWLAYLEFVIAFPAIRITMVRHIAARALTALPATQHHVLWRPLRAWAASPAIPRATCRAIWRLYLAFDHTTTAKRQYFSHLQQRQDTAEYVRECARFVEEASRSGRAVDAHLFKDTAFWEPLVSAFQEPGWFVEEDSDADSAAALSSALDKLAACGKELCASPLRLQLAYISFLYGQGNTREGRQALLQLLDEAPDGQTLTQVFRLAVELEDQVVESFALSETAQRLQRENASTYTDVVLSIFGSADPTENLRRLVENYPLLLNQAQLRTGPRNVLLWLKRVELLQERLYSSKATAADVTALFRQAIAQCTAGMETVDPAAGQLYQSYALHLCSSGAPKEAAQQLMEAAWSVKFLSVSVNATLLGLSVELQLLMGSGPAEVTTSLLHILQGKPSSPAAGVAGGRRHRSALLHSSHATLDNAQHSFLYKDARPWLLAAEIASCGTVTSPAPLREVAALYRASSTAYTAEGSVALACLLWNRHGDAAGATRELECALSRFRSNAVATLFLAQQYLSFAHVSAPKERPVSLLRLRELFHTVEEAAPAAMPLVPTATLNLLITCAFMECRRGLCGNAVRIIQSAANMAVRHLDPSKHYVLLSCIVEKAIQLTQHLRGCLGARQYCSALVRTIGDAALIQRVALHWAALEKRCGGYEQAFAVLDACANSQNPSTPHGTVYWRLWESLCANIQDFEKVTRRKQQVEVRYRKRA